MVRKLIALAIFVIAWELLSYTVSDSLFRGHVIKIETRSRGGITESKENLVEVFNSDLFQALNVFGLALLILLIAYMVYRGPEVRNS
jgi:hypothetical protein